MATQNRLFTLPFVASSNVSAITLTGNPPVYSSGGLVQFTAVILDTATGNNRDIKGATTANAPILGILQNTTVAAGSNQSGAITAGDGADVMIYGVSKMVASGAISNGALISVNGSGQATTAAAAGATDTYVIGIALTAATEANNLIEVLLMPLTTQVNA